MECKKNESIIFNGQDTTESKICFDSNNKTKKNHIVPQAYLRYFKKSKKNDIYVYHKKMNEITSNNISTIGLENKLYVIEDNSKKKYYSWEDYYTRYVDNTINNVFKKVLQNANCKINIKPLWDYQLRLDIINIISHQMLRTHEKIYSYFKEYPEEIDRILKEVKEEYVNEEIIEKIKGVLLQESVYKSFALPTVNIIAQNNKIKNVLLNKTWTLLCNNTNLDFVTSDTPVVLYDYRIGKASIHYGLESKSTLLAYPICPKYMLVLFPNDFLLGSLRMNYHLGRIECNQNDVIEFYNSLQYRISNRQIYARREEELNLLKRKILVEQFYKVKFF